MTRPDLALHRDPPEDWRLTGLAAHCQTTHEPDDSRMTATAGQRSDKIRWPNGRFMKADSYYGGPVYKERREEYLSYKELRPGLVSGLY